MLRNQSGIPENHREAPTFALPAARNFSARMPKRARGRHGVLSGRSRARAMSNSHAAPVVNISAIFFAIKSNTRSLLKIMQHTLNFIAALATITAIASFDSVCSAQPQPSQTLQKIEIIRHDPRFDKLVPVNVIVERIV